MTWLVTLTRWLCRHEPILTYARDGAGVPVTPAVIVWRCAKCQAVIGETALRPSWSLLARLRRQRAAQRAARRAS